MLELLSQYSGFEWAAILGVLAWTPHVISIFRKWLSKPVVRVITNRTPEVGFNTLGPIFNLPLAFTVSNKDLVVTEIQVRLRHESGQECLFLWQGMTQTIGTMHTPDNSAMPFQRDSSVLAIKLKTSEVEERSIRFQEKKFLEGRIEVSKEALKRLAYLQSVGDFDGVKFLQTPEMKEWYNHIHQSFPWKPGVYNVGIEINSLDGVDFRIEGDQYTFALLPLDIERLDGNKKLVELDFHHALNGLREGEQRVNWNWCYPIMQKI